MKKKTLSYYTKFYITVEKGNEGTTFRVLNKDFKTSLEMVTPIDNIIGDLALFEEAVETAIWAVRRHLDKKESLSFAHYPLHDIEGKISVANDDNKEKFIIVKYEAETL